MSFYLLAYCLQSLGQVGRVLKEFSSGDVQVCVDGRRWTFNSCCLQPAPDEDPPYHSGKIVTLVVAFEFLRMFLYIKWN